MKLARLSVSSFATSLWLLTVCTPSVRADATADARRAIQTAYDKMDAAAARKDAKAMLAYYASDFQFISAKGRKRDLKFQQETLPRVLAAAQSMRGKTTVRKLTLKGREAKALVHSRGVMTFINRNTQQISTLIVESVSKEIWSKTGQRWLKKRVRNLSEKQTLDGRLVPTS